MILLYYLILGCSTSDLLDRESFENQWWEVQQYPVCFNFHTYEENELLIYQSVIENHGPWEFVEPNQYEISDETLTVTQNEECWEVDGYKSYKIDACECSLISWDHSRKIDWSDLTTPVNNKVGQ